MNRRCLALSSKRKTEWIYAYLNYAEAAAFGGYLRRAYHAGRHAAKLGSAEGYNYMAQALVSEGRVDEGLAVLRQSMQDIPGWPSCHHFLSMAFKRTEKFGEYVAVCDQALRFAEADFDLVLYLKAWALQKLGQEDPRHYEEALACLAKTPASNNLEIRYVVDRVRILRILKRFSEARQEVERALADESLMSQPYGMADLQAQHARILWEDGHLSEPALAACWAALRDETYHTDALQLLRQIENRPGGGIAYQIEAERPSHPNVAEGELQWRVTLRCEVVADKPEEALQLLTRVEPPETLESLLITNVTKMTADRTCAPQRSRYQKI